MFNYVNNTGRWCRYTIPKEEAIEFHNHQILQGKSGHQCEKWSHKIHQALRLEIRLKVPL